MMKETIKEKIWDEKDFYFVFDGAVWNKSLGTGRVLHQKFWKGG